MPHVLIVDDDEAIGAFLGRLLESKGWRVSIAKDAAAALALVAGNNFDVALLDKNLPDMTGLDLVPHVRKSLPEVEIIIMTAHADTRSLLQAMFTDVFFDPTGEPRLILANSPFEALLKITADGQLASDASD